MNYGVMLTFKFSIKFPPRKYVKLGVMKAKSNRSEILILS